MAAGNGSAVTGRLSAAARSLRDGGIRSTAWRGGKWLAGRLNAFQGAPLESVYADDLVAVDWSMPVPFNAREVARPPSGYRVAWLITPPGRTSGGHQNAFRFMSFLERAGNPTTVFLYSPARYPSVSIDGVRRMMAETTAYPDIRGEFRVYDPTAGLPGDFDAIVACDWETTYAAHRHGGAAKRFYFTQDFEPAFFPWGSDYAAAENSYRLGFHGFSAGRWLAERLAADYGMSVDPYDYAVDTTRYHHVNTAPRNEVLFYARPPTPRRATEFGLLALRELHRRRPDVTINLVGWDMSGYDVPFPYVNHSAVDIAELNAIYNRCAAGLDGVVRAHSDVCIARSKAATNAAPGSDQSVSATDLAMSAACAAWSGRSRAVTSRSARAAGAIGVNSMCGLSSTPRVFGASFTTGTTPAPITSIGRRDMFVSDRMSPAAHRL